MAEHMIIGHLVNTYKVFGYGFYLEMGWFTLAAVEALRKKERHDETQFTTKLVGKLLWVPDILFCKIFIPSYTFDALLCQNWSFLPLLT
jgi:hypothetical protein